MIESVLMGIAAFIFVAALDIVWVGYTVAMQERKALIGGAYAAFIYAFGGSVVLGYTSHPWLLIPSVVGAFAGTYAAVWWKTAPPNSGA